MFPLSKPLTLLRWRRVAARVRHHSSLTTELIENMDKKATWDRFYTENNSRTPTFKNFEWFFGFDSVRDFIMPLLQTKSHPDALLQVLDMGCGTSALGPCIYRHSPLPVRVTCADISPIAVRLMQEHIQAKAIQPNNVSSQLEFVELDCTHIHKHYGSSSVDLIVDKGTTDALLRSKEGKGKAALVLKQCLKVLRSSGSLLQFSDEDPDARLLWLETEAQEPGVMAADVGVQEVGELRGVCYYCYQVTPRCIVQE
ncbi:methyltransferase-like protein 12, mitochondrial [Seriola lalandi dorsalis]|uniref:methyltransferase-like protein 12, mitochondrial n=1 Tax=Seriola lalandi dorsalis TaxID=1841481 RepID=UPI000C6F5344|nr:methyltransferase-like protein 12, mitochondrial [Seriola lalandi dorsalis]